MDPPPPPPQAPLPSATSPNTSATTAQLIHPEPVASPRSHNVDSSCDEPLPPVPGGAKLRLMCSYGGHIIPRPHDKSLCYLGGETRIVVVDRHSSLSSLSSRLSRTLLDGRSFTLKYQLPNEDLDSLVSITTDEDLENMIEEYDRTTSINPLKPSRLRLFLFQVKPETTASMGPLLDDAKSETWFVDALNSSGFLQRGVSDSATMDCLAEGIVRVKSSSELGAQTELMGDFKQAKSAEDLHSMPDAPIIENDSSFGSSSSSPSMSNLPPIKVRVDEQFSQMCVAPFSSATASAGSTMANSSAVNVGPVIVSNENSSRVYWDDEKSEQGFAGRSRKPPLPQQPVQQKLGVGGGFNLLSPDSVASDGTSASASSLQKPVYYQDPIQAPPNPSHLDHYQQQQQQQQLAQAQAHAHAQVHYVHNPQAGPIPMSSYYQMYTPSSHQLHHTMDQQFPVYVMPYPTRATTTAPPSEMEASSIYRTAVPPTHSQLVQVPSNQFSQTHHPSQSISASGASVDYGFDYGTPGHEQVYYNTQQTTSPLPPQYQTMTSSASAVFSEASIQLPTDSS